MFKMIIALTILCASTFAFAEDIKCSYSINAEPAYETEVFTVLPNTKETFVDAEDYRFFISNKGDSKFELEVFDATAPSRSYATGYLRSASDEISWAFWSRDILIEISCKLAQ